MNASVGALSYGASLVVYVHVLRCIGTGHTATCFQTAPSVGAALSVGFLGDALTARLRVSAVFTMLAVVLLLREHHEHRHDEILHEHTHEHDEHHRINMKPINPGSLV
jgi:drug/metabolite transporter (DMT)-like permease